MCSLLYLRRCSQISFLRKYTSVVSIRSFHPDGNCKRKRQTSELIKSSASPGCSILVSHNTQLLNLSLPISTQVRTFWEYFPYMRPLFYEKDRMDRNKYELAYHSGLFHYAFYAQFFVYLSLTSQFIGASYYAFQSYLAQEVVHTITTVGPYVVNYDLKTIMIITAFNLQNCLLYYAARTVVLRAYYCEDTEEFVLVSLAANPLKSKYHRCNAGDLIPKKDSILNCAFGNHKLNDKNLFLQFSKFKTMYHYNKLIGDHNEEFN